LRGRAAGDGEEQGGGEGGGGAHGSPDERRTFEKARRRAAVFLRSGSPPLRFATARHSLPQRACAWRSRRRTTGRGTTMAEKRRRARAPLDVYLNKYVGGVPYMARSKDISRDGLQLAHLIEPSLGAKKIGLQFQLP